MTNEAMATIQERFKPVLARFLGSNTIAKLQNGDLTIEQYRSIMRQIFHHTRENPQLQALATVHFRGHQRKAIKRFYRHASSEIGHDQLALNDYKTLDGDPAAVPYENPLPATLGVLSFGFYQIYNLNHLGYLGYLFFLEYMPTSSGGGMMQALEAAGVPDDAMTFLNDHTEIDVGHNKLMETYVADLIKNERQIDTVVSAMHTTGDLYAKMLDDAVDFADKPYDVGWNWQELEADGITPSDL